MRRAIVALSAVLVVSGVAWAQERPDASPEQLKCYEPLVGNWVYQGPALEEIPGVLAKGDSMVARFTWKWIVNKHALETRWTLEAPAKTTVEGRGLIAWDSAESRIVGGSVDSVGAHGLDVITYDAATKTWTTKSRGADGQGRATTGTIVIKLVSADTLTWQLTEQTGGDMTAPSSVYTFKRGAADREPSGTTAAGTDKGKVRRPDPTRVEAATNKAEEGKEGKEGKRP
jgi:hypothetical protein